MKVLLRKSNSGNWGLFYYKKVVCGWKPFKFKCVRKSALGFLQYVPVYQTDYVLTPLLLATTEEKLMEQARDLPGIEIVTTDSKDVVTCVPR